MIPKIHRLAVTVSLLVAVAAGARAAAGDPPPSSLDLGAAKPKPEASSALNPGGILPIGQSPLTKQKTTTDAGAVGTTGSPGVGTAIKSPLGSKGVLGSLATGGKSAQPAPDDPAASNDVVVKMPSNMKK
jgi:hypothetical protein